MKPTPIPLMLLVMAPTVVFGASKDHAPRADGVVVEHAQVQLPAGDAVGRLYLTVWNGTSAAVELVDVSPGGLRGSLGSTQGVADQGWIHESGEVFPIPARSELVMKPDGVWIRARDLPGGLAAGDSLPLVIVLADGRRMEVVAETLSAFASPIDHHHGEGDSGHGR